MRYFLQFTNLPPLGTLAVGMFRPAAAQPPCSRMSPVPLMVMSSMTMTKQDLPLLDLFTAPLSVTLECGK